jgi:hypothetical protein
MESLNSKKFDTLSPEAMGSLNGGKWVYQWHSSDMDGNTQVMYYQDSGFMRFFGRDYKQEVDHT